jgi:hypothetical protein
MEGRREQEVTVTAMSIVERDALQKRTLRVLTA